MTFVQPEGDELVVASPRQLLDALLALLAEAGLRTNGPAGRG
jgi:hypothetical protein